MVGGKEAGTESRFKQWTMMEGLPSVASQDANMHKNGEKGNFESALIGSSCQGRNSSDENCLASSAGILNIFCVNVS